MSEIEEKLRLRAARNEKFRVHHAESRNVVLGFISLPTLNDLSGTRLSMQQRAQLALYLLGVDQIDSGGGRYV